MTSNGENGIHGRRRKQDTRPAGGQKAAIGAGLAVIAVIVLLIILF